MAGPPSGEKSSGDGFFIGRQKNENGGGTKQRRQLEMLEMSTFVWLEILVGVAVAAGITFIGIFS